MSYMLGFVNKESGADSDWSIENANDYKYYLTLEGLQYASGRYNEVEMSVEFNNTSWGIEYNDSDNGKFRLEYLSAPDIGFSIMKDKICIIEEGEGIVSSKENEFAPYSIAPKMFKFNEDISSLIPDDAYFYKYKGKVTKLIIKKVKK